MPERIHRLLHELKGELGKADTLDEPTRERMRALAQELDEAADPGHERQFEADVLTQVEQAAVSFEAEHPRIAGILGGIADTLAKLGI